MQTYALPCDWQISLPDNWSAEYDEANGQCVFYPDNSDLTVRITPFHAEKDNEPAPIQIMEAVYINTIPKSAVPLNIIPYEIAGFSAKIYENNFIEDDMTVFAIYLGYYAAGELLSVNIFSTNKIECCQTLDILQNITKADKYF